VRRPEWNDEEADEDRPTRTYGYRAALGPDKWASSETAAGVFGGGAPADVARPQSRVRPPRPQPRPTRPTNTGPPLSGPPLPKPIVLPAPLPAAEPIPIARKTPVRWVGRDAKKSPPSQTPASGQRAPASPTPQPAPRLVPQPALWPTSKPTPTPMPPPPPPTSMPQPTFMPSAEPEVPAQLSTHPLRTPAPAVTSIRVLPTPIDGFDYQTASMWFNEARPPAPPPPPEPIVGTVLNTYPLKQWPTEDPGVVESPVISWLDEDD
jgi:hypothetical protein